MDKGSDMGIVKAELADLDQCVDILFIPELGKLYFPKRELLRSEVEKSIHSEEVFVEKTLQEPTIQGVIWYQRKGLFHSFPYLHMIAVRDECRHQGVGARLMDFFEQDLLRAGKNRMRTKVFLLVSAFNASARQFYRNRGYEEVSRFENLFRKSVTEILLMKKVTAAKTK